jgi:hypothetical protein
VFARLYKKKAHECDTKEKCERFLREHDGIMKKARMAHSTIDNETRKMVENKLKSF